MKLNRLNIFFLFLLVSMFIISFTSASLGTFRQGDCVNIVVPLNATNVTLTNINSPSPSFVMLSNKLMTQNNFLFNYIFCNTTLTGTYTYGFCDNEGNCYGNDFSISANGQNFTSAQSIIYFVIYILLILLFIFSVYSFAVIPFNNPRNEEGNLIAVDWKKYLKIASLGLAYITLVGLLYFSWNISYGLLGFTEMANFFYAFFRISFVLMFVALPVMFIYAVFKFVNDMKIAKELMRGLTVQ